MAKFMQNLHDKTVRAFGGHVEISPGTHPERYNEHGYAHPAGGDLIVGGHNSGWGLILEMEDDSVSSAERVELDKQAVRELPRLLQTLGLTELLPSGPFSDLAPSHQQDSDNEAVMDLHTP